MQWDVNIMNSSIFLARSLYDTKDDFIASGRLLDTIRQVSIRINSNIVINSSKCITGFLHGIQQGLILMQYCIQITFRSPVALQGALC